MKGWKESDHPSLLCHKDVSNLDDGWIIQKFSNDEVDDVVIDDEGREISIRGYLTFMDNKVVDLLGEDSSWSEGKDKGKPVNGKTCPSNDETYSILESWKNGL